MITYVILNYNKYLYIPESISSPRFMIEPNKGVTVIFIQSLGIPDKVRSKLLILKKILCPVPDWTKVHVIQFGFILVRHSNLFLSELSHK